MSDTANNTANQRAIKKAFDESDTLLQIQGPAGQIRLAPAANILVTNAVRFCETNPHEIFSAYQTMRQRIMTITENGKSELFLFAISPEHIDDINTVKSPKETRYTKILALEFKSKLPQPGLGPTHTQTLTLKDITGKFYKTPAK